MMSRIKSLFAIAIVITTLLVGAQPIQAVPIAGIIQETNQTPAVGGTGDAFTIGYKFIVGSNNLTVSSLGTWDGDATDGLAASHDVGIWNADGSTLLGSVTVPAGTGATKIGSWRYVDLSSAVTLFANTEYVIGSAVLGDSYHGSLIAPAALPDFPVFSTPNVNFVHRSAVAGAALAFPNITAFSDITSAWDAPNFRYEAVPEPGSLGLLGIALASLVLSQGRKCFSKQ